MYIYYIVLYYTTPFLVTGEKEKTGQSVNVRTRDGSVHGVRPLLEFLSTLRDENNLHFK